MNKVDHISMLKKWKLRDRTFVLLNVARKHVDKIDLSSQFHQCFTRAFFVPKFVQNQTLSREKTFVHKICSFNVDKIDLR